MPRLLPLLTLAALPALAQTNLDWQQVGGSLGVTTTSKGIVGQGYETPLQSDNTYQLQGGFLASPLLVNSLPFLVTSFQDLSKETGFATIRIPLGEHFADLEGDSLGYSVVVSGPVSAEVVGDTLLVKAKESYTGTASVTVTATEPARPQPEEVTSTFSVTVQAANGIHTAPRQAVSKILNARVPKIFASTVAGIGNGALRSGTCAEAGDCLSLELLLPGAASVSVSIFDQIGTPVIALDQEIAKADLAALAPSGDGRHLLPLTWNLRAGNGQPVAAGVYLWKIKVRTADGQLLETVHRMGVKGR